MIKETKKEMEEIVRRIIAEELQVRLDEVTLTAKIIDDLGAESISVITIISEIEDAFDVEIDYDDYDKVATLNDILEVLSTK